MSDSLLEALRDRFVSWLLIWLSHDVFPKLRRRVLGDNKIAPTLSSSATEDSTLSELVYNRDDRANYSCNLV
ncbi:hypothetical protein [Limnofasciculus baicalensis]|uniref:Uncharacterized protein n=1 Tax=Limnofasciculus baicalensis BBK-W-15 TaxID=2699891 RepID=A0AAE3GSZ5_9CYAN|nr:hypothetical protein [Limnofasciculus baicalensis]MCP2729228.1 hypothetical protein [Limnofasciculus baicalensis BBK-W-15]